MNLLSTKGDLLRYIDARACAYRATAIESITRNAHMNHFRGHAISQEAVDAILVDFVNHIGIHQGLDYAMYVKDLDGLRQP
jgi:hypothetical protein